MANQAQLDLSRFLEFQGRSVVGLLIAILFVLISASVEPSQVRQLLPAGRALVAVMVLVLRPLTVALCTWRSTLRGAERAFMAGSPPGDRRRCDDGLRVRAAAHAGRHPGRRGQPAGRLRRHRRDLVLNGLTAAPVARLLGLTGAGAGVVLVVGGSRWMREIARPGAHVGRPATAPVDGSNR